MTKEAPKRHVTFHENFNWDVPGTDDTRAYKAGFSGLVDKPCADAAISKGRATETKSAVAKTKS